MTLSAADDHFHPIADPDPLWTETSWWGFHIPDADIGGMVYTLFRPNLGVASLVVNIWDAAAVEPWLVPYSRSMWHLPHPTADLTACEIGGLSITCVEPLAEYRLRYADGSLAQFDLTYRGLQPPQDVATAGGNGHFDQVCQVTGTVSLGARRWAVDSPAVRDRSWYVRADRRTLRAGYTYAVVSADEHLIAHSFAAPEGGEEATILSGYLQRDGVRSPLKSGTRRVLGRRRGHPSAIALDAFDAEGRSVTAMGEVRASMASQSTPGMFAWMSVVAWTVDGMPATGEDHDVWSPDLLGPPAGASD
jgi:hypothetical protein